MIRGLHCTANEVGWGQIEFVSDDMASLLAALQSLGYAGSFPQDVEINGFSNDSRRLVVGEVFLAYPGCSFDGRDFIEQAIAKGAAACLVERVGFLSCGDYAVPVIPIENLQSKLGVLLSSVFGNPSENLNVVGITGTNGKSSCVFFLAQAYEALGIKSGVLGTIGNGVWPRIKQSELTTLDPIGLHKWMHRFLTAPVEKVAMEVSSHALAQSRVDNVCFDVAVFTSLSHEHLDYHETMEAYAKAKYKLFQFPSISVGVTNLDDPYGVALLKQRTDIRWIGYTLQDNAGCSEVVRADNILTLPDGVEFTVHSPWGGWTVRLPLFGRFNVANVLAVIAVLGANGLSLLELKMAISSLFPVKGRMQVISTIDQPTIVVDYAHTPDALKHALLSLSEHFSGKVWCVFGCGGDRDKVKRPMMAAIAEQMADRVIVTSDNCRSESIDQILADIRAGFKDSAAAVEIVDRLAAITYAVQSASKDDIVLLAGKGHETQLSFTDASGCEEFSDLELAKEVLKIHSGDNA